MYSRTVLHSKQYNYIKVWTALFTSAGRGEKRWARLPALARSATASPRPHRGSEPPRRRALWDNNKNSFHSHQRLKKNCLNWQQKILKLGIGKSLLLTQRVIHWNWYLFKPILNLPAAELSRPGEARVQPASFPLCWGRQTPGDLKPLPALFSVISDKFAHLYIRRASDERSDTVSDLSLFFTTSSHTVPLSWPSTFWLDRLHFSLAEPSVLPWPLLQPHSVTLGHLNAFHQIHDW